MQRGQIGALVVVDEDAVAGNRILFAVGGKVWGPQCHLMRLKKDGRIVERDSWEEPVKVVRRDGTPLTTDGITLDMTCLRY